MQDNGIYVGKASLTKPLRHALAQYVEKKGEDINCLDPVALDPRAGFKPDFHQHLLKIMAVHWPCARDKVIHFLSDACGCITCMAVVYIHVCVYVDSWCTYCARKDYVKTPR